MKKRRLNPHLAKIHRSYTVEELARLFSVHRKTVREWVRQGLPTVDKKRPWLILGREVVAFLQARRAKNKRPCGPGQIYCVGCRLPKNPAGDMVDYMSVTDALGKLTGICPDCGALMHQRISLAKFERNFYHLGVTMPQAVSRIAENS